MRMSMLLLMAFTLTSQAHAHSLPEDQSKAVILAYHRIGEDAHPDTNLRTEQFQAHLKEFQTQNYTVLPLPEIIQALKNNTPLPRKTLGITFEGAFSSAYTNAMQPLMEAKIPFTVFYAAGKADQNISAFMNWEQLKTLNASPTVSLATLPANYIRSAYLDEQTLLKSINKARQRHREAFKKEANFLSYPFGEYSTAFKNTAQKQGYSAAFTLNAGVAYAGADSFALPRFTMTESYGSLERLRLIANSLPLPVTDFEPRDTILNTDTLAIGFTMPEGLKTAPSCFLSDGLEKNTEQIGSRIEIRSSLAEISDRRIRLNCTIDVSQKDEAPMWRWLGKLFHLPEETEINLEPDVLP